jgi:hypothetical protein
MPPQDPTRRYIAEYRTIALDLASRMSDILAAMKKKPDLFNREKVIAARDFAMEGLRQRGGSTATQSSNAAPEQIADDLNLTLSRIESLSGKLARGRFGRDALVLAGNSIRAASLE